MKIGSKTNGHAGNNPHNWWGIKYFLVFCCGAGLRRTMPQEFFAAGPSRALLLLLMMLTTTTYAIDITCCSKLGVTGGERYNCCCLWFMFAAIVTTHFLWQVVSMIDAFRPLTFGMDRTKKSCIDECFVNATETTIPFWIPWIPCNYWVERLRMKGLSSSLSQQIVCLFYFQLQKQSLNFKLEKRAS